MVETTAQRTLVKSPPELWAELSDPGALARHLGEISGEIRITRVEPETTVVWEGERATGRVELRPSGWGTKVTLTVTAPAATPEGAETPAASEQADAPKPTTADAGIPPADVPSGVPAALATRRTDTTPAGAAELATPEADTPPAEAPKPATTELATREAHTPPAGAPSPGPAAEPGPSGAAGPLDSAPATGEPAVPDEVPEAPIGDGIPEADDGAAPEPVATDAPAPVPAKRGFFARLFGRRRGEGASDVERPEPAAAGQTSLEQRSEDAPQLGAPETAQRPAGTAPELSLAEPGPEPEASLAEPGPEPESSLAEPEPEPEPELGPTPAEAEADDPPAAVDPGSGVAAIDVDEVSAGGLDPERASELLTGVLDALGAAHHRPFSRG